MHPSIRILAVGVAGLILSGCAANTPTTTAGMYPAGNANGAMAQGGTAMGTGAMGAGTMANGATGAGAMGAGAMGTGAMGTGAMGTGTGAMGTGAMGTGTGAMGTGAMGAGAMGTGAMGTAMQNMIAKGMPDAQAQAAGMGTDGAPIINVSGTEATCRADRTTVAAGKTWVRIVNQGMQSTQLYLETAQTKELIVVENVQPGQAGAFAMNAQAGQYLLACEPIAAGGQQIRTPLTVTA